MWGVMTDWTTVFEPERPRLLGLAYRILGSYADAEDVVQEAWVRASRADPADIDNAAAWLTTVTSRLALDRLRHLSRRREDYVGPWLPEPVSATGDPAATAELADSLTLGFLVLLDRLGPTERVVFLLAEVFDEPYARIAAVVGKSEDACRQIASRARRRVRPDEEATPRPADRDLLESLVTAIALGDESGLVALLSPDVRLVSDGGADHYAARRPVLGADKVARLLVNITKRQPPTTEVDWRTVNGQAALATFRDGRPRLVLVADELDGAVVAIRLVVNLDKLRHVDEPVPLV